MRPQKLIFPVIVVSAFLMIMLIKNSEDIEAMEHQIESLELRLASAEYQRQFWKEHAENQQKYHSMLCEKEVDNIQ